MYKLVKVSFSMISLDDRSPCGLRIRFCICSSSSSASGSNCRRHCSHPADPNLLSETIECSASVGCDVLAAAAALGGGLRRLERSSLVALLAFFASILNWNGLSLFCLP